MKTLKQVFFRACMILTVFSFICGILYTGFVLCFAQIAFPYQANGSIIEIDGKQYGSELLGQSFHKDTYMWGRIMNIDVTTYTDTNGNQLLYAVPSNLSSESEEYGELVKQRVEALHQANPAMDETAIPVDLVTCSGSGLDPHISMAAATYQVARIATARGITKHEVEEIINQCSDTPFLGIFGEKTVNVLKVNLMLDGILKESDHL